MGREEYLAEIRYVTKCRRELIHNKLLPAGGRVPRTNPDKFYIVSKDIQNNNNWRLTYFDIEGNEATPSAHSVVNTLTRDENPGQLGSLEEILSDVDWKAWEKQK
jgi:hypothetical protein